MPSERDQDVNEFDPQDADGDEAFADDAVGDAEGAALAAEVENLRAEKQALFERLARAQADYQNAQKRIERDMNERLKLAAGQLVKAFLPVLDNLERALDVPDTADVQSVVAGVRGTVDQWIDVLRKNGVEPLDPEPGTPFQPGQHEALMQEEADYDSQSVTRVLQKGYTFEGRVLRPAQVAVSRPK